MQTKIGNLGREGGTQVALTTDTVYVVQLNNSGPALGTSTLYQWAR